MCFSGLKSVYYWLCKQIKVIKTNKSYRSPVVDRGCGQMMCEGKTGAMIMIVFRGF